MQRYRLIGYFTLLFLAAFVYMMASGVIGGQDNPELCVTCESEGVTCSLIVEVDTVFPGHMAHVPVNFYLEAGEEIIAIMVRMTLETGLTYYSIDTAGTDWPTTVDNSSSGTDITIDFTSNTLDGDDGPYFHLLDLIVQVDDSVSFSNSKDLVFEANGYQVRTPDSTWCDADSIDGLVTIPQGDAWFWMDTTLGYSYQAQDSTADPEKYVLIEIPVTFKSTYPADSLLIGIREPYTGANFQGFDPGPGTHAYLTGAMTTYYLHDDSTLFKPDTVYTLGTLKFKGDDTLFTAYLEYSFSKFDSTWFDDDTSFVYCDSSDQYLPWESLTTSSGGIQYPVYSCSTSIGTENIDVDLEVSVPVNANHTFWSQYYEYYVKFNSRCIELDTVTSGPGANVQFVNRFHEETSGDYKTYRVQASPSNQTGKYVLPNSNETIFYLDFTASDSFANSSSYSTTVSFNTTSYDSEVEDYFHPFSDQIHRVSDSTSYFYLSSGSVEVPLFFAVAIDTVSTGCDSNYSIPVRVSRVTQNIIDSVYFRIDCPSIQYAKITGFSFVDSDYLIGDSDYDVDMGGVGIDVYFGIRAGEISTEGIVGHLKCARRDSVESFVELNFDYWYNESSVSVGLATHKFDGGIEACTGGGPKQISPGVPEVYALNQNYPNPFNAETKISFTIPKPGQVEISVFDILGRRVRKLIEGQYRSGTHDVIWDGKNDTGRILSSGIYFYAIQTEHYNQSKKMLMLK
ncbi:MAG: T9SS type A sorting domain-containing protein [candidate division Zixibacteria bacterium]